MPDLTVGYLSEFDRAYSIGLQGCRTLADLKEYVNGWSPFADDACQIVNKMTEADFEEYVRGNKLESKGRSAGKEWQEKYSAVLLPEILFFASIVATQYQVPWGTAFIRLREAGLLALVGNNWIRKEKNQNA